jgi:hypothetical protein
MRHPCPKALDALAARQRERVVMREGLLILASVILAGSLLVPLVGLLLYSPFGSLLALIAHLPSPIGELVFVAIMLPIGIAGPPAVWGLCYWALARLFRQKV